MGMAAPTVEEFFDTEFLTALQGFSLWARRIINGGRHAEQLSRDKGAGLEFADYKAYVPGDDTRTIDWNIYRRLGRVVVKVFEERQELPVYLLVDRSGSMYFEAAPKIGVALKVALALTSISLSQHDSVGLFSFSNDLEMKLRAASGHGRLMRVAERLAELDEQGSTELVQAIQGVERLRLRRGLLVVISDFYDPAGLEEVLGSLRQTRHRLLLVQLIGNHDLDPSGRRDLRGDVRLRDCESGESVDVSLTPAILENYRAIVNDFNDSLTRFATERGAAFLRLNTDEEVLPQLAAAFEAGSIEI